MTFLNDEGFDSGLNWVQDGTRIDLCDDDPGSDYTLATNPSTGYSIGNKTGLVLTGPADGAQDGRIVTVPQINDGTITNTGTATHWALTDGSNVVASGALASSKGYTAGNKFSLDPIIINYRDAGVTATITLYAGPSVITKESATTANARIIVDQDGYTYYSEDEGSINPLRTRFSSEWADDWCRPVSEAPGDYEVRWLQVSGETPSSVTGSTPAGTWRALSLSDFVVTNTANVGNPIQSSTISIEIRRGSTGSALDSGQYLLIASYGT